MDQTRYIIKCLSLYKLAQQQVQMVMFSCANTTTAQYPSDAAIRQAGAATIKSYQVIERTDLMYYSIPSLFRCVYTQHGVHLTDGSTFIHKHPVPIMCGVQAFLCGVSKPITGCSHDSCTQLLYWTMAGKQHQQHNKHAAMVRMCCLP